jgi:hypothetical protein
LTVADGQDEAGRTWAAAAGKWSTGLLTALTLAAVGTVAYVGWRHYGEQVLAHATYRLRPESIEFTAPPEWVRRDVLADVLPYLGELDVHQVDLTPRVADAFRLHPWVAEVKRVRKRYPASVAVDLVYRRPVAMVEVQPAGLQPIDEQGIWLLPEDFTPEQAQTYPRISVGNTTPAGPPGTAWGDALVASAARVAAFVGEAWGELGLYRIEPSSQPAQIPAAADLDLVSRDRSLRVHWGRPPGAELPGEVDAADKLAYLRKVLQGGTPGPGVIDLRLLARVPAETARRGTPPDTSRGR